MSYFNTQQIPLAGFADIFKGGTTDFQSILDASFFDRGPASDSDLTQTTAAPATGPSGSVSSSAEQPKNSLGLGFDLNNEQQFQLALLDRLKGERSTPEDDERKFRMIQQLQREGAERANKMGRKNMLLGSLLKDIPKAVTNMAMAGTVYNAQNAVGPYNAAQYGRRYFT